MPDHGTVPDFALNVERTPSKMLFESTVPLLLPLVTDSLEPRPLAALAYPLSSLIWIRPAFCRS